MQAPMAETDSREPRGRTIAFRIVAGLLGLATVVLSVPFAVGSLTDEQEKIHAFHNIGAGMASGIVFGVGLLLAAWKPWEMIAPFQVIFLA